MKRQSVINLVIVLLAFSPVLYLFIAWSSIPETFVTKFELNRAFEKIQSRKTLLIATVILSIASAFFYLLMRNLKSVDPKVTGETPDYSFHKLGFFITLFLVAMNYFLILSAKNALIINTSVATLFFGLLVVIIGNYMNNLKPNYIAGIRLPWTLNDPENWRKTHQLAGKLWFVGGIILIIVSFLLPKQFLIPLMIILIIGLVVIPGVYSYRIYRRKSN